MEIRVFQDVLGLKPKLLGFIGWVQSLAPTCQIQKTNNGEGQRKEIYYMSQADMGRGNVAFQPIFSHLLQIDICLSLNGRKKWGQ
jgi:hypothetical protein